MTTRAKAIQERDALLIKALSHSDCEGSNRPDTPGSPSQGACPAALPLANAELVQLQTRVIALENLVIALLADASDWQIGLARQGAACIRPRSGFTPHPLTIHAADQMDHLVQRSATFRVNRKL